MQFKPPDLDALSPGQLQDLRKVLNVLVAYCDQRTLLLEASDKDAPVFQEKLLELHGRLPAWARWELQPVRTVLQPFTEPSKRVIELAEKEARRRGMGDIDTEHLLLAVLTEGTHGLPDPQALRAAVEARAPWGRENPEAIYFTENVKRAITLAFEEQRSERVKQVEPDHFVIGLAGAEGLAAEVLHSVGLDRATLREARRRGS